jgi:hypothetical protein
MRTPRGASRPRYPPHQFHQGLRYVALKREQAGESFRDFYQRQEPKAASGNCTGRRASWPAAAARRQPRRLRAAAGGDVRAAGLRRLRRAAPGHPAPRCRSPGAHQPRRRHRRHLVHRADPDPGRPKSCRSRDWAAELGISTRRAWSSSTMRAARSSAPRLPEGLPHPRRLDYVATGAYRMSPTSSAGSSIAPMPCTPAASTTT